MEQYEVFIQEQFKKIKPEKGFVVGYQFMRNMIQNILGNDDAKHRCKCQVEKKKTIAKQRKIYDYLLHVLPIMQIKKEELEALLKLVQEQMPMTDEACQHFLTTIRNYTIHEKGLYHFLENSGLMGADIYLRIVQNPSNVVVTKVDYRRLTYTPIYGCRKEVTVDRENHKKTKIKAIVPVIYTTADMIENIRVYGDLYAYYMSQKEEDDCFINSLVRQYAAIHHLDPTSYLENVLFVNKRQKIRK